MATTKSKKSTKKVEYKQQERSVIAFLLVSHGSWVWSIGKDPSIVHATRCVRKAKRDYGIKGWQVIPVNIYDIEDCENWAFDGGTLVDVDKQDKTSEDYLKGRHFNAYRGCQPLKFIETLEVVS